MLPSFILVIRDYAQHALAANRLTLDGLEPNNSVYLRF